MAQCWERRGCDEEMMSRCPHNIPGEPCPADCRFAACTRSTHEVCQDFNKLLNPERDYDAAVKEVCRFCEHFLEHGPGVAERTGEVTRQGTPNRFLLYQGEPVRNTRIREERATIAASNRGRAGHLRGRALPPYQQRTDERETMAEQAHGTLKVKTGFAEMMKGGVIMDVVNPEQAKIAEDAGAVAVMALERVPADIRAHGGVARMSDPTMIEGIVEAVSIPVMAKCRIGHFVEAQVLQSLGVDFIDESEVLTPADDEYHVNKWDFDVPFV